MSETHHTAEDLFQQGAESKSTDSSDSQQTRTGMPGLLRKGKNRFARCAQKV